MNERLSQILQSFRGQGGLFGSDAGGTGDRSNGTKNALSVRECRISFKRRTVYG